MTVNLDLTPQQIELLSDLVFCKYNELDEQEDSLLVARDFSLCMDRSNSYQKRIDEVRSILNDLRQITVQLRKVKEEA